MLTQISFRVLCESYSQAIHRGCTISIVDRKIWGNHRTSSNQYWRVLFLDIFGDINIKKTSTTDQLLNREVPPQESTAFLGLVFLERNLA